jgi:hypothetical protein
MAKKTTLNEISEMLEHDVKHMATKDDIAELRHELMGSIERRLRDTKTETRLGKLEEKVFGAARR